MSSIRIGTWNIKNNYYNLKKNNMKIVAIEELLTRTDLDILALQEVSGVLLNKLEKELGLCYYHLDRYIYSDNPLMPTPFEIHNIVIVRDNFINNTDVLKLKTLSPKGNILDFTALSNRYISKVYIKDEKDDKVCFNLYNVNLNNKEEVLSTQLESLSEKINEKNDNIPMIIMGSLNITPSSFEMARLKYSSLNKNGLRPINIGEKTVKYSEEMEATDHIIAPNSYRVEEVNVVKDYANVSSHYPVLTKLKIK